MLLADFLADLLLADDGFGGQPDLLDRDRLLGHDRAFGVQPDLKDNTHYSVYLGQGGIGLPDRDYYTDQTNPKFAEARAKYKEHVANMLRLARIGCSEIFAAQLKATGR